MPDVTYLKKAVDYIEGNLSNPLTVAEIAQQAAMSSFHFQRLFSIAFDCTVGEYIRCRRLSLAAVEVVSTSTPLIQIAYTYGYDTPEGFSRAFHKHFGVSPSAARSRGTALPEFSKARLSIFQTEREEQQMDNITSFGNRGYYVKENAPIYFTKDMEKTCAWFREVLGWYGDIVGRDEDGTPIYGCVFDYPGELIVANLTPFRGIHLFYGEAIQGVAGFIYVQGLDKLHSMVLEKGWEQITDIASTPWNARECQVTTPDGSILRFFETLE